MSESIASVDEQMEEYPNQSGWITDKFAELDFFTTAFSITPSRTFSPSLSFLAFIHLSTLVERSTIAVWMTWTSSRSYDPHQNVLTTQQYHVCDEERYGLLPTLWQFNTKKLINSQWAIIHSLQESRESNKCQRGVDLFWLVLYHRIFKKTRHDTDHPLETN